MKKLKNLANKDKMEVYINKLKFYGEKERLSCTERQNKKLAFWLTGKEITNNKNGSYQEKIKEWLKEHQNDIKNAKNNTAIARLSLKENIKIYFKNTKKVSNYNYRTYGYCRETIEIKNNSTTCNDAEHFFFSNRNGNVV